MSWRDVVRQIVRDNYEIGDTFTTVDVTNLLHKLYPKQDRGRSMCWGRLDTMRKYREVELVQRGGKGVSTVWRRIE